MEEAKEAERPNVWGVRAPQNAISLASLLESERHEEEKPKPAGKKGKNTQWKAVDLASLSQPARVESSGNCGNNGNNGTAGMLGSGKSGSEGIASKPVLSFKEIQRQQQEEKEKEKEKAGAQGGWGSVLRQNVLPTSLIMREKKEEATQAKQTMQMKQTKQTTQMKVETKSENFLDLAKKKAGKTETRRMEGEGKSEAFEEWCRDQMLELYGSDDISLLEFCRDLDDSQILPYLQDLLGTSKRVTEFGKEFIRRKHL